MVFLFNVNFVETRLVKKCLETFYAIGTQHSTQLLAKYSIYPRAKMGEIPAKTMQALTNELSTMTIESEARRKVRADIMRLKDIGAYRGRRHAMGLPVRGQITRSQIMTSRKLNRIHRKG